MESLRDQGDQPIVIKKLHHSSASLAALRAAFAIATLSLRWSYVSLIWTKKKVAHVHKKCRWVGLKVPVLVIQWSEHRRCWKKDIKTENNSQDKYGETSEPIKNKIEISDTLQSANGYTSRQRHLHRDTKETKLKRLKGVKQVKRKMVDVFWSTIWMALLLYIKRAVFGKYWYYGSVFYYRVLEGPVRGEGHFRGRGGVFADRLVALLIFF